MVDLLNCEGKGIEESVDKRLCDVTIARLPTTYARNLFRYFPRLIVMGTVGRSTPYSRSDILDSCIVASSNGRLRNDQDVEMWQVHKCFECCI